MLTERDFIGMKFKIWGKYKNGHGAIDIAQCSGRPHNIFCL